MIHDMVFDPTELRTLGIAFDEAWESLRAQRNSTGSPELRLRLASLILRLARDHQLGQDQITATALRLLTDHDPVLVATA